MTEIFRVAYGLPIVGCMFFYGVQFVPAKLRSTYNGAVFQWFMSSGGLFVALILGELLSDEVPGGHYAGLLGGALVAVSNGIILHLKRRLGLFTSVVLYQAANLITGYCVGRFGLFNVPPDPGRWPYLRDVGVALLLASLRLLSVRPTTDKPVERVRAMSVLSDPLVEVTAEDFEGCDPETISLVIQETDPDDLFLNVQELRSSENQPDLQRAISDRIMRRRSEASQAALLFGVDEEEAGPGPSRRRSWPQLGHLPPGLPPGSPNPPRSSATSTPSVNQRRSSLQTVNLPDVCSMASLPHTPPKTCSIVLGWLLAGVAGVCRGLNPVPFAMWHRTYPSTQSACFVFPMALGVWASSTTIYLGYTSCKKVLHLRSPAKPNIRPAFLSGCFWALGFACFAKSLDDIGYTATYMLSVIGPVLVSQLISVFIFKEIQDTTQLRWFAASCVVQAFGLSCIVLGT
ncbi:unnamed protein product [Durusdinium trenchii]|uniref:Uncharacterized protein n=1 Tax=Durusdinium trenchii TaxID=1381693 RepID=A0ABP0S252_9DINO